MVSESGPRMCTKGVPLNVGGPLEVDTGRRQSSTTNFSVRQNAVCGIVLGAPVVTEPSHLPALLSPPILHVL